MERLNSAVNEERSAHAKLRPFQLEYELLLQRALAQGHDENWMADQVAAFSADLKPNDVHEQLAELPFEHVLTTNYDLTLESARIGEGRAAALVNDGYVRETRYSLVRRFTVDSTTYWHIHGDIRHPRTAALGLEHYSGYLQQIRNYVVDGVSYEKGSIGPLMRRLEKDDWPAEPDSWVDLFLSPGEVHIIGYGLDFTETHLWWLLTFRTRRSAVGRVIFHDRATSDDAYRDIRDQTLRSLGVELVLHDGHTWPEYYDALLADLRARTT